MPDEGGLHINCAQCGNELLEPGSLLFTPPDAAGLVGKYHFCVFCFLEIRDLLRDLRASCDDDALKVTAVGWEKKTITLESVVDHSPLEEAAPKHEGEWIRPAIYIPGDPPRPTAKETAVMNFAGRTVSSEDWAKGHLEGPGFKEDDDVLLDKNGLARAAYIFPIGDY